MCAREWEHLPADLARGLSRFGRGEVWRKVGSRIRIRCGVWLQVWHSRMGSVARHRYLAWLLYGLKERVEAAGEPPAGDLILCGTACSDRGWQAVSFELSNVSGTTMRVQLLGYDAADVATLLAASECRVMLQITPQMKILVAVEPADFRRGIDGLARLRRERPAGIRWRVRRLCSQPQGDGAEGTDVRWPGLLALSQATLQRAVSPGGLAGSEEGAERLAAHQLPVLFSAGNPTQPAAAPDWRPVGPRA